MKISVLATGLSGLVGSRIQELLSEEFEFNDLSLATGVDITDNEAVKKNIENSSAKVILHLAAKTDVDGCEDDKILGEEGSAWLVNVEGTRNIVEAARKYGKRVIYISTDFVFDGTKEYYQENDIPNPVNWYGYSKHEGERIVETSGINYCIARLAYPYRSFFPGKTDFVRRIIEKMRTKEEILAVTDHIFTPTFIDDIVSALKVLLQRELSGIYHVVGSQSLTVYDATKLIAEKLGLGVKIKPVTRGVYFRGRAFRPFRLILKNGKISKLGVKMRSFVEGLEELKRQKTQST